MFNTHDISRNACQLFGEQARCGYDWWWHSFTGHHEKTGEERAFFIEFFLCNPEYGMEKPVFGQLPENKEKGIKPSYLMVKAGTWGKDAVQLHRFFGWKEIKVDYGVPFRIKADDCYVSEDKTKGSVSILEKESADHPEWMCGSGEMSWKLKIDKQIAFNVGYGASEPMRDLQAFEMFWHAEGMKTAYEGEVIFNGEKYIITPETSYGYADKNWGKDFTSPWVWISSCNLTSEITGKKLENSVFDIGGGRPKVGIIALERKLLSAFWYEGTPYEFNFSKVWTLTKTEFECHETDTQIVWHIEQENRHDRMITDLTCEKADMLLVNYEAPNGEKKHNRLWNGGNGRGTVELYHEGELIDRIRVENAGCEYGEYDVDEEPETVNGKPDMERRTEIDNRKRDTETRSETDNRKPDMERRTETDNGKLNMEENTESGHKEYDTCYEQSCQSYDTDEIRSVDVSEVTSAVREMCIGANLRLAPDMKAALDKAFSCEKSELGKKILGQLEDNLKIADADEIPICQDTGMAVVFLKIGQDVHFTGGSLKDAINKGVREGYTAGYLRKSVVSDPLLRENTDDNTPAIIHTEIVEGNKVEITIAPKGFGSENMSRIFMLKPADGIEGVKNAVITAVKDAGANACPPMVVGVGIGADFEKCAVLAKKALTNELNSVHSYYEDKAVTFVSSGTESSGSGSLRTGLSGTELSGTDSLRTHLPGDDSSRTDHLKYKSENAEFAATTGAKNGRKQPDTSYLTDLQRDLFETLNELDIGPGGMGGKNTVLGVNIETYPTHIAGMPVAVNICCHVNRHVTRVL